MALAVILTVCFCTGGMFVQAAEPSGEVPSAEELSVENGLLLDFNMDSIENGSVTNSVDNRAFAVPVSYTHLLWQPDTFQTRKRAPQSAGAMPGRMSGCWHLPLLRAALLSGASPGGEGRLCERDHYGYHEKGDSGSAGIRPLRPLCLPL